MATMMTLTVSRPRPDLEHKDHLRDIGVARALWLEVTEPHSPLLSPGAALMQEGAKASLRLTQVLSDETHKVFYLLGSHHTDLS